MTASELAELRTRLAKLERLILAPARSLRYSKQHKKKQTKGKPPFRRRLDGL